MTAPRMPAAAGAWLDRRPWLPVVLILLLPWLVHLPQWILGLSTDPIWFFSGVTEGSRAGLFPGLPDADPNAGWTAETLGRLAALDWAHGIVPWWDPYAGIGMPLAGEMQPAAFFLPFVFLLLLPGGVFWLGIAIDTVAGLAAYALCRELALGRLAALTGAALFALNGTLAWFAHAPAYPVAFLPLLLLGIEQARRPGAFGGVFWVGVGVAWLVLAGFPETAYVVGLFALLWAAFRLFGAHGGRLRYAARVAAGGLLGLLLAAPQLIAFADDLAQSEIVAQYRMGTLAPSWHGFPIFLMPYVYGPLTQFWGNQDLWRMWGDAGGYCGVVALLLALRGTLGRTQRGLRLLLLGWVLLAWAKIFAVAPVQALMNRIPFLLQVDFARYSAPSWELALILLAAFAIDDLGRERSRPSLPVLVLPFLAALGLLAAAVGLAWPGDAFFAWPADMLAPMFGRLWLALGIAAGLLCCCLAAFLLLRGTARCALLAGLALAEAALLFAAPELNGFHPGHLDRTAIRFLATHLGLERLYAIGPLEPNYPGYFGFAAINHAVAPAPARWNAYIGSKLFAPFAGSFGETFWSAMGGGPDLGPGELLRNLANYETVGVRYIVTAPDPAWHNAVDLPAGISGNQPLALGPGQQAEAAFPAPPPPGAPLLASIGVDIGNYANTSDGSLAVRLCDPSGCAAGSRPLAQSADNVLFFVSFDRPPAFAPGTALLLTIRHEGGLRPVALWLWPAVAGSGQALRGPAGKLPGKALRLSLHYQVPGFPLRAVYSDRVMTIWRMPHPSPYFSIATGGPCVLRAASRRALTADCTAPASLIRRELFMPGWSALVNEARVPVAPSGEIFQAIALPAGKSAVRFSFAPPGILWGWIAASLGALGLIASLRRPRRDQAATFAASRASP